MAGASARRWPRAGNSGSRCPRASSAGASSNSAPDDSSRRWRLRLPRHQGPPHRQRIVLEPAIAPQEELVDEPIRRPGGNRVDMLEGLPEESIGAPTVEELRQLQAAFLDKVQYSIIRVPEEIVGHFVPRPVHGCAENQEAAGLKYSPHF